MRWLAYNTMHNSAWHGCGRLRRGEHLTDLLPPCVHHASAGQTAQRGTDADWARATVRLEQAVQLGVTEQRSRVRV